jgi:hypothetical protein
LRTLLKKIEIFLINIKIFTALTKSFTNIFDPIDKIFLNNLPLSLDFLFNKPILLLVKTLNRFYFNLFDFA